METNGKMDQATMDRLMAAVSNAAETRTQLFQQYFGTMMDRRRDINTECGYPESGSITPWMLQAFHEREPLAARVNSLMAEECWKVYPEIVEDEDAEEPSEFDEAVRDLGQSLRGKSWHKPTESSGSAINSYLKRLDRQCGIGSYGVLLFGFDDGLDYSKPVKGVIEQGSDPTSEPQVGVNDAGHIELTPGPIKEPSFQRYTLTTNAPKQRPKLLFLRIFPQALAQVSQWENNRASPRFGQPVMYLITFNDPNQASFAYASPIETTRSVHWTRVLHVADNLASSEVLGVPRCVPVLNPLLDVQKIRAADGEGYWRNAFAQLFLEMLPEFADVPEDKAALRSMMEQMQNGLQRWGVLSGFSAKSVPPVIVDPTPHMDTQINVICIQLTCPRRIFEGSERGELSSAQDSDEWAGRVQGRRDDFCTPSIVCGFYDRLIMVGVLPEPEQYIVKWPKKASLTEQEKATVAMTKTQALVAYISGGGEQMVTPLAFLSQWLDFDDEEAEQMLEDVEEHLEEKEQEDIEKQQMLIAKGLVPDPTAPKPLPPVKLRDGETLVKQEDGLPLA